jgi:hypothetical protein
VFPVPSHERLSFAKIAKYWALDFERPVTTQELVNALAKAWWKGELLASGTKRADVLRAIYHSQPDLVVFAFPETLEPSQISVAGDGTINVRPWCIPLPNSRPETWDDDNCADSFNEIAAVWDHAPHIFELTFPVVRGLKVTEPEFTKWVRLKDYQTPTFWACRNGSGDGPPSKKTSMMRAIRLAQEYYDLEKKERRHPTQSGFEKWIEAKQERGSRDVFRTAFKRVAGPLRRGPPHH